MGRAGAGSGGGGRPSGGHTSSRASGGHSMGGGAKPRAGMGMNSGSSSQGFHKSSSSSSSSMRPGGGNIGSSPGFGGFSMPPHREEPRRMDPSRPKPVKPKPEPKIVVNVGTNAGRRQPPPPVHMPPPPPPRVYTPRPEPRVVVVNTGGGNSRPPVDTRPAYTGAGGASGGDKKKAPAAAIAVACVASAVMLLFLVLFFASLGKSSGSVPVSTYNREVLSGTFYDPDCVIDELGWVDSISNTGKMLRAFWEQTGVQPFVYLKAYDPELVTEDDKVAYAEQFYEENMDNEYTFLVVYFGEEDADTDVGYVAQVRGYDASTVVDAEAVDIFYTYWDSYLYSDLSTDDVLAQSFADTAGRIMEKTPTKAGAFKWLVLAFISLAIGCALTFIVALVCNRKREAALETERILNTPLEKLSGADKDPDVEKYL